MARIRSVKPSFFRHEALQALAVEKGLHLMLVFEGLWTQCDSKGRFEWRPNQLKLDILPFVPYEMEAALETLREAGFIVRYTVSGKEYGWVPTFLDHQRITGKEKTEGEKYPPYPEKRRGNTRETPVTHRRRRGEGPVVQELELGKGKGEDTPLPPAGDKCDLIREALTEAFHLVPVTDQEHESLAQAAEVLRAKGARPEDVKSALAAYRAAWPKAIATLAALVRWWDTFAPKGPRGTSGESVELRAKREREEAEEAAWLAMSPEDQERELAAARARMQGAP